MTSQISLKIDRCGTTRWAASPLNTTTYIVDLSLSTVQRRSKVGRHASALDGLLTISLPRFIKKSPVVSVWFYRVTVQDLIHHKVSRRTVHVIPIPVHV